MDIFKSFISLYINYIYIYQFLLLSIPPIPWFLSNISPLLKIPLPCCYPSSHLQCISPLLPTETVVGVRILALGVLFTKYLRSICLIPFPAWYLFFKYCINFLRFNPSPDCKSFDLGYFFLLIYFLFNLYPCHFPLLQSPHHVLEQYLHYSL